MFEPSIKQIEPVTVAFKAMTGSFEQIPEGYGALYGWLGAQGLQPAGMPQAVYLTMPGETAEDEARWELWAPVAGDAPDSGPDAEGLGIKHVPPAVVASVMYKGPYGGVAPTYEQLFRWIATQGYRTAGPPSELYYSDPAETPPDESLTEIRIPVIEA